MVVACCWSAASGNVLGELVSSSVLSAWQTTSLQSDREIGNRSRRSLQYNRNLRGTLSACCPPTGGGEGDLPDSYIPPPVRGGGGDSKQVEAASAISRAQTASALALAKPRSSIDHLQNGEQPHAHDVRHGIPLKLHFGTRQDSSCSKFRALPHSLTRHPRNFV